MKTRLFPLLLLCLLAGCRKKDERSHSPDGCTYNCTANIMPIIFSDQFTLEEIDSIQLTVYKADGTFTQVETDTLLTLDDTIKVSAGPYQTERGFRMLEMIPEHDYQVKLLSTGQTIRIWDIKDPDVTQTITCKAGGCKASIYSFDISGSGHMTTGSQFEYGVLWLMK